MGAHPTGLGAAFIAAAVSALSARHLRLSGSLLCAMFLSWVVVLHIPRIAAAPGIETRWTSGFVALAMAGIGLLLAGGSDEAQGFVALTTAIGASAVWARRRRRLRE